MTLLPIADRELRVAARKRGTYWSRVIAAGLAMFIAAGVLIVVQLNGEGLNRYAGPVLFNIFKWLSFVFVCTAGIFLTSDCLSEEKREGTLGLLFLTDLRGYDVVFGKLLATSLKAAYGLLAAFPVMALGFLLGGVTGGEFWRLLLALCNTLLFSLATGVFISSVSRDAHKAVAGTLVVAFVFVLILPLIDLLVAGWDFTAFTPTVSTASPMIAFIKSSSSSRTFWVCTLVQHALAWGLLGAASWLAPRTWQEKSVPSVAAPPGGTVSAAGGFSSRPRHGHYGPAGRRAALFAVNPARWLAGGDQWLSRFLWIFMTVTGGLIVLICFSLPVGQAGSYIAYYLMKLVVMVFNVCLAVQASRFFVEARRNGALELLLVTPLGMANLVRGQAWALLRTFLVPGALLVLVLAGLSVWQISFYLRSMTAIGSAAATATVFDGLILGQILQLLLSLTLLCTGTLAVAWFGMWMGMTTARTNVAAIKTLSFVQVLPWVARVFVQYVLMGVLMTLIFGRGGGGQGGWGFWVPTFLTGLAAIAGDIVFIVISRRRLHERFMEYAARGLGPVMMAAPVRAAAPSANAPPVLAS